MEKVPMTGADRIKKYRDLNPKNVELLQLRQNVKRQDINKDPEKAAAVREAIFSKMPKIGLNIKKRHYFKNVTT